MLDKKEYSKIWREKNRKRSRFLTKRWKLENPDKLNEQRIRYRKRHAKKISEYAAIYKIKNLEKKRAHDKIRSHILTGRLIKGKCVKCGNPKSQGHHEDYSKPLEVIWLCAKHHKILHLKKNQIFRKTTP